MNKFQVASDLFIDPLDALLNEAVKEQSRKGPAKPLPSKDSKAELAARPKLHAGFYEADSWTHTRTVSLIHQPSNTLLGNFRELYYTGDRVLNLHALIPRKLVRVTEPVATDGTEFVTGDWWLQQISERRADPKSWIESRKAIIDIALAECGLYCDSAEVNVRLEYGWIARVELIADTRFTCAERNTFLILPAGLDVLEAMTVEARVGLKEELHVGEDSE